MVKQKIIKAESPKMINTKATLSNLYCLNQWQYEDQQHCLNACTQNLNCNYFVYMYLWSTDCKWPCVLLFATRMYLFDTNLKNPACIKINEPEKKDTI